MESERHVGRLGMLWIVGGMALLWGHAEAQPINGCYTHPTGQLYLIGLPGAPAACRPGDTRVRFPGTRANTFTGNQTINAELAVTPSVAPPSRFNVNPHGVVIEVAAGVGQVLTANCLPTSDCWGISAEGTDTGVYAQGPYAGVFARSPGWAGWFDGNVNVVGTLVKSGGGFRIDHPQDPANKYLTHSFVESPDMMNVYNGVADLDANGAAWVSLPDWFEALNRDFRYQLTAMGQASPNLHVAKEVSGNRFRIEGGHPGGRASWQVTGIRHDAYAETHRLKVEEAKAPEDRGYYLHPGAFKEPAEKSILSRRDAKRKQAQLQQEKKN